MKISGNRLLIDVHQSVANVLIETQRLPTTAGSGNLWPAVQEHEQVLEAIEMRDPDEASYYMRKHISMAGSRAGLHAIDIP